MKKSFILLSVFFLIVLIQGYSAQTTETDENIVVNQMIPMKVNRFADRVEKSAVDWTNLFISEKYRPAGNLRYVYIPGDKEPQVDMLRIRYTIEDEIITITQTRCIFSIEVTPSIKNNNESTRKNLKAEEIARRIFRNNKGLVLKISSEKNNRLEGSVDKDYQQKDACWLNEMLWWQEQDRVFFYFIKKENEELSSVCAGFVYLVNDVWFQQKETALSKNLNREKNKNIPETKK